MFFQSTVNKPQIAWGVKAEKTLLIGLKQLHFGNFISK